MKNLKTKTSRIATAFIIVLFAFSAASLLAAGKKTPPPPPSTLIISFDENFTGDCAPGDPCIDGTTTLAGAYSDKGTRHQDNTVVGVSPDGTHVFVTGTVTITGDSGGVLTTQYSGTIVFDGTTNIAYITGTEYITGGTGIYTGATGRGLFEATIDQDTGNIVGAANFNVSR